MGGKFLWKMIWVGSLKQLARQISNGIARAIMEAWKSSVSEGMDLPDVWLEGSVLRQVMRGKSVD